LPSEGKGHTFESCRVRQGKPGKSAKKAETRAISGFPAFSKQFEA
jgi:hypothetical protein